MVKSQPDRNDPSVVSAKKTPDSEGPPKIPPRMKKKGPALPEKPPHMRANPSLNPSSQQTTRDPLKPRVLLSNIDSRQPQREVLVAASRAIREKPVEKRQREPAKLLMPTFGGGNAGGTILRKDIVILPSRKTFLDDQVLLPPLGARRELALLPSKTVDDQVLLSRKDIVLVPSKMDDRLVFPVRKGDTSKTRKSRQQPGPLLLIPRAPVSSWGSPVSFALWPQRDPSKGGRREPARQAPMERQPSSRSRSGSVTRSGSLTSQGSSSSDSGNETFPKSVLKKQKRNLSNTTSRGSSIVNSSSKKLEQKKNVTFNAFATVQLMEE